MRSNYRFGYRRERGWLLPAHNNALSRITRTPGQRDAGAVYAGTSQAGREHL